MAEIVQVETPEQIADARKLYQEWADELGVDLCFQRFGEELANLPGKYAPPDGQLLLAVHDGDIAGCVALRKLEPGVCEMKRLYVRPQYRGEKIGKQLATRIIDEAKAIGYERMRLDTISGIMDTAIGMYRAFGFREIDPYYDNPIGGTIYMELIL
jgi:ribosomal protein S18 acetylase RimI-like enzyme